MTDQDNASSGSFAHAFLPGLILGLVIGAAAGAFLPDLLGGAHIPAPTGAGSPAHTDERDAREREPSPEEIQDMIDGAVDEAEGVVPTDPPAIPPAGSP